MEVITPCKRYCCRRTKSPSVIACSVTIIAVDAGKPAKAACGGLARGQARPFWGAQCAGDESSTSIFAGYLISLVAEQGRSIERTASSGGGRRLAAGSRCVANCPSTDRCSSGEGAGVSRPAAAAAQELAAGLRVPIAGAVPQAKGGARCVIGPVAFFRSLSGVVSTHRAGAIGLTTSWAGRGVSPVADLRPLTHGVATELTGSDRRILYEELVAVPRAGEGHAVPVIPAVETEHDADGCRPEASGVWHRKREPLGDHLEETRLELDGLHHRGAIRRRRVLILEEGSCAVRAPEVCRQV